jgi:broad specificity phosphatase PhoE
MVFSMQHRDTRQLNLWLIRHGESTWNASGRVQGQDDSASLTKVGQRQARKLASALGTLPIGAVFSSDLRRAQETALRLADVLSVPVQLDARLRERSFGACEGSPHSVLTPELSGIANGTIVDTRARPLGGESIDDVSRRTASFISDIRCSAIESDIAVVAHGGSIRMLVAHCGSVPLVSLPWEPVGNCAVFRLDLPRSGADLCREYPSIECEVNA